jgi:hypothetical protein
MGAVIPAGEPMPGDPRRMTYLEARLRLLEGRPHEALALLGGLPPVKRGFPRADVEVGLLAARAAFEAGERDEALRLAATLLTTLDRPEASAMGPGHRFRHASDLAQLLEQMEADPELQWGAGEVAASAAVERAWEAGGVARACPEAAQAQPDDLEALLEFRQRFLADHARACARATLRLAAGPPPGAAAWPVDDHRGFVPICAWCRRVRTRENAWLPLGHFVAGLGRATHGICPGCRTRAEARPLPP